MAIFIKQQKRPFFNKFLKEKERKKRILLSTYELQKCVRE